MRCADCHTAEAVEPGDFCAGCAAVRVERLDAEARAAEAAAAAEERRAQGVREAAFYERVERMLGSRSWNDGDPVGVRCTGCGQSYVFSTLRGIVHPAGGCTLSKLEARAAMAMAEPAPVRRTYHEEMDD